MSHQVCRTLALLLVSASLAIANEPAPLIAEGADSVTFKLHDKQGKTPRILLFKDSAQAETAESINFWRGTRDPEQPGVVVEFRGIRFLRVPDRPGEVNIRLVGLKNEFELGKPVRLEELESGKPYELRFGPAEMGALLISAVTSAEMVMVYDPQHRKIHIKKVSGDFQWKRPFADPKTDSGTITDVTGQPGNVPPGAATLKPQPEAETVPKEARSK